MSPDALENGSGLFIVEIGGIKGVPGFSFLFPDIEIFLKIFPSMVNLW